MPLKKKGSKKKKGGRRKKKSGPKTFPLEIAASGGEDLVPSLPVKTTAATQSFTKLIATFVVKYAHPAMPKFTAKQLALTPIETTDSLMRNNTLVEFYIGGKKVPFWLTEGPDPQKPAEEGEKEGEGDNAASADDFEIDIGDLEGGSASEEEEPPAYHSATVKADVGSEFTIHISNEFVFSKIAAEVFVDSEPTLPAGNKFLIDPAPAPATIIDGFHQFDANLERDEADPHLRVMPIRRFMFQKRLAVNDALARDIVNAGFDGEIVINVYQ